MSWQGVCLGDVSTAVQGFGWSEECRTADNDGLLRGLADLIRLSSEEITGCPVI